MKKVLFPLLLILSFTACKKETSPDLLSEDIASTVVKGKKGKIDVCHYDKETGKSHTININENALSAHLAHGDALGSCVPTIKICNQVWTARNLDITNFRNGTTIPQATTLAEWSAAGIAGTGAWSYYNFDPANGAIYGKLYNWYAVNDSRGLAPAGWHLPKNSEWATLANCLGGVAVAGGKMKTTGTIEDATGLWFSPNLNATNSSGFTGLPGGVNFRTTSEFRGVVGGWWTSEQYDASRGYNTLLFFIDGTLYLNDFTDKKAGYSIRCVKD